MKTIIGLVGQRGSGKTTVADHLCDHYGYRQYAYGDPVKKICQDLFLLSDQQLIDRELKEASDPRWGSSPRHMFQWFGTDVMRQQWTPDFWVRRLRLLIEHDMYPKIVISDIRFQNEADDIHDFACRNGYQCIIIRIDRTQIADSHISETESLTIPPTFTILNHRSIRDLLHDIDERLTEYGLSLLPVPSLPASQEQVGHLVEREMPIRAQPVRSGRDAHDPSVHDDLSGMLLHA